MLGLNFAFVFLGIFVVVSLELIFNEEMTQTDMTLNVIFSQTHCPAECGDATSHHAGEQLDIDVLCFFSDELERPALPEPNVSYQLPQLVAVVPLMVLVLTI